jgi:superoxide dismutase, Fe-Mn family
MDYEIAPLPFKPHRLEGLSDRLLLSHYENNYGGAVRRLNAIGKRLADLDWATAPVFEINGLKREELIAMNSMILHEVYFDGLGEGGGGDPAGALAAALERDFGSVARWKAGFVALAKAQGGGSGWTLVSWSPRAGRLVNAWAADHTHGVADGLPVLALDMYEHAYHMDFGAKAAAYVDAVMRNIHWQRVGDRYGRIIAGLPPASPAPVDAAGAPMATVAELKTRLDGGEEIALLDVCLREDLDRKGDALPRARWRDPERIAEWASEVRRGVPVIAYCLYGFQVSQNAAAEMRKLGIDARSLSGGIAAWRASGFATEPIPPSGAGGRAQNRRQ